MKLLKLIFILTFSLCCILLFTGCDKFHARKLSGTYTCQIHSSCYSMGSTSNDTTYTDEVVVKHKKKNIIFLNNTIPIDSLWDGHVYYVGNGGSNYFKLQFINDSVYCYSYSGGLGGGCGIQYIGKKK